MTNFQISVLVFLQIAVILGACRLMGWLVRPLGQPQVVAEMITGVLLGPSLLGLLLPMFFVSSGLNTRIGLLDRASLWGLAALVLLVAGLQPRLRPGERSGDRGAAVPGDLARTDLG